MVYSLKEYQRDAVDELKGLFELYFKSTSRKEIVFKAPTGSGKTFMASSLMEELASENSDINFCIMWACPGKGELHKQSFDNVKRYLGGNPVCSLLEEDFFGSRKYIKNHEIVFINWEKLIQKDKETGKWANNLMKDQEGQNFIDVIDQTRRNGTKVILIIDESHIGKSAKARIQEFINTIICPNIVLEMSATPLNEHIDVVIEPQKVIDEGMIKEDVIVNEGISKEDRSMEDTDSELLVLEKGYLKREELKKEYEVIGSLVNPLVLIQIPNVDEGEAKKLVIKDFLREKGITEDNGKLKFWCDDKGHFDKKTDIVECSQFEENCSNDDLPIIARNSQMGAGNLWYEQVLPHKSVFGTFLVYPPVIEVSIKDASKSEDTMAEPANKKAESKTVSIDMTEAINKTFDNKIVQIGANATIGYGYCSFIKVKEE